MKKEAICLRQERKISHWEDHLSRAQVPQMNAYDWLAAASLSQVRDPYLSEQLVQPPLLFPHLPPTDLFFLFTTLKTKLIRLIIL